MASPVDFKGSNKVWKGFTKEDGTEVWDLQTLTQGDNIVSCWKLTWYERLLTLLTGRVWLGVMAHRQPPVWVTGRCPVRWTREVE